MRTLLRKIELNPIHTIIGLVQIGIGVFLMIHDEYFRWPPDASVLLFFNDDVFGWIFTLIGFGFLWWVLDGERSVRWDHHLLVISGGMLFALTTYQFLHWVYLGIDMPWISNSALTAIIMILAARSDSGEE